MPNNTILKLLLMLCLAQSGCSDQVADAGSVAINPKASPAAPAAAPLAQSVLSPAINAMPTDVTALAQGQIAGVHVTTSEQGIRTYSGGNSTPAEAATSPQNSLVSPREEISSPPPQGITTDAAGNIYIEDSNTGTIRQVTPDGQVMPVDANMLANSQNRVAVSGDSNTVARDASGNVYIADTNNHIVHQITPDGTSTLLGGGTLQEMMRRQQVN